MDLDQTFTSRVRILAAARALFARQGYEQTSTAAIARSAGSSESQLVRYFGGKCGLLEAIFEEAWAPLNHAVEARLATAQTGRQAVLAIVTLMIEAFSHDRETASIFLFEGRRFRGNEFILSEGFVAFRERVQAVIRDGQKDGSFRPDLDPAVLLSAMLGAAEGMIRDALIAERRGLAKSPGHDEALRAVFGAMIDGLGISPAATPEPAKVGSSVATTGLSTSP